MVCKGASAEPTTRRRVIITLCLLFLLALSAFLALLCGQYSVSFQETVSALCPWLLPGVEVTDTAQRVVWNMRMPRIILAILTGAGLGMSGAAFQGLFSNPLATPDTLFATGDTLYVLGHRDAVERFAADYHVQVHHDEERGDRCKLDFYEIGLAELLLTPGSSLVGRPLRAANFRERFGVSILALKRRRQYLFDNIQDEILRPGDMMLVHGAWKSIESLAHKRREWLVVGRPLETAEHVTLDHKAPLAAVIMALMVFFMVFDVLPVAPVGIVIIAALLMVLTGCMRSVDAAYKSIGWESIVLIAAMMPMSTALEKTGVSAQVSEAIVTGLGTYGPLAALAGVYAATSLLSTFISNSATAILVAPIAMQTAAQMGVDPAPFLMTAAVAASACFAAPISTPPNAMVMSAGRYTFMDYVKVGVPLQIAIGVVAIFAIPLLFPF